MDIITNYLQTNWIELVAFASGFIYIFLEIAENKWMWPLGFITSLFLGIVFFQGKFYADSGLQIYYLIMSVYGWYCWSKNKFIESSGKKTPITRLKLRVGIILGLITIGGYFILSQLLIRYSDSPVAHWDAALTALSITATWMLARKIIEHWFFWIFVNGVSSILYFNRDMKITAILIFIYTVLSVIGYIRWRKIYSIQEHEVG